MSLFSIFSKAPPEPTSVAEALAGSAGQSRGSNRRSESHADKAQSEQLIPEKKRARRRLIGAVVIVLAVVIGLPMLLDSEPKPLNKNISIQIPSRDAVSQPRQERVQDDTPVASQITPAPALVVASPPAVSTPTVTKAAEPDNRRVLEPSTDKSSDNKPAEKQLEKQPDRVSEKPSEKTEAPIKPKTANTAGANNDARAMAILDGVYPGAVAKSGSPVASTVTVPSEKVVIQVGAFTTQEKVKELQSKLNSAGIQSFTQKVATSSGDKIRVRIGPFADRDAAARVKAQCEKLGLLPTLIPQ